MTKAEVQWLQRNDLTRLDYDARYAAEFNWIKPGTVTKNMQFLVTDL